MPGDRSQFEDSRGYEPVDYWLLDGILKRLRLCQDDVLYDIGCGFGRVVCVAACKNLKSACGVELDATMAEIAMANAETLRRPHAPIRIVVGDAAKQDYCDGTVFVLFNPFGGRTMQAVLDRIEESLRIAPRVIRIAYYHPVEQQMFAECGWLTLENTWKSAWFRHPTQFWRSATLLPLS